MARTLHHGPIRHGFAAHEQGDADDALVADHGDFGGRAILHDVQQGHDGGGREIDVAQPIPGLVQGLTERQRDQFQVGKQALAFGLGQDRQQMILPRVQRDWT